MKRVDQRKFCMMFELDMHVGVDSVRRWSISQ